MLTNVINKLEIDRISLRTNIKSRLHCIECQKLELLESLHALNHYREVLKEVEEAIEKLKAE